MMHRTLSICLATLMIAPSASAADLVRLDYDDGVYYKADGRGYEFTIGCENAQTVEYRLEATSLPSAAKNANNNINLRFIDFNSKPTDISTRARYSTYEGRDVLIGKMPFDDTLSLGLENAIGIRISAQNGDTIMGDSISGFDDLLFFMEEYCE